MTKIQSRIQKQLLDFQANTSEPRWSSYLLEELFKSVASEGGTSSDILKPLYSLVGQPHLSKVLANFNSDVARYAFSSFRNTNQTADLEWMRDAVATGCTAPQAHLALYTLPTELLTPSCVLSILKALAETPYWSEAVVNLEEETEKGEVRDLLTAWLSEGVAVGCRTDVERLAGIAS
jgi:hypothetical protein